MTTGGGYRGRPEAGRPQANQLDRAREVDVRVETVRRVVARHEVDASRVNDVEAAAWIEAHLEEVAKHEVTGRRNLDRVDQAVVHRAAKARRRARVHVPVSIHGLVREVADAHRAPVGRDVHPAVADEAGLWRCD